MNDVCKALKEIVKPWALLSRCHRKETYKSSTVAFHCPQAPGPGLCLSGKPQPQPGIRFIAAILPSTDSKKKKRQDLFKEGSEQQDTEPSSSNSRVPWGWGEGMGSGKRVRKKKRDVILSWPRGDPETERESQHVLQIE